MAWPIEFGSFGNDLNSIEFPLPPPPYWLFNFCDFHRQTLHQHQQIVQIRHQHPHNNGTGQSHQQQTQQMMTMSSPPQQPQNVQVG